jgi:hypothetical protein
MSRTGKLVRNEQSQADHRTVVSKVQRFNGRRDAKTAEAIFSQRRNSWEGFFELMESIDVPDDFLADRNDRSPQKRRLS